MKLLHNSNAIARVALAIAGRRVTQRYNARLLHLAVKPSAEESHVPAASYVANEMVLRTPESQKESCGVDTPAPVQSTKKGSSKSPGLRVEPKSTSKPKKKKKKRKSEPKSKRRKSGAIVLSSESMARSETQRSDVLDTLKKSEPARGAGTNHVSGEFLRGMIKQLDEREKMGLLAILQNPGVQVRGESSERRPFEKREFLQTRGRRLARDKKEGLFAMLGRPRLAVRGESSEGRAFEKREFLQTRSQRLARDKKEKEELFAILGRPGLAVRGESSERRRFGKRELLQTKSQRLARDKKKPLFAVLKHPGLGVRERWNGGWGKDKLAPPVNNSRASRPASTPTGEPPPPPHQLLHYSHRIQGYIQGQGSTEGADIYPSRFVVQSQG
ncbi:hypothetical protein BU15DRAFT_80165 [Melanogaster broomeanus]|nr:hypothetical protein BU15DRAFT_80165 [Melanogaster broomeanus]